MPRTPSEPLHTEKPPSNPWWRLMHEASDTFDGATRSSMVDAANVLRESSLADVEARLEDDDVNGAVDAMAWELYEKTVREALASQMQSIIDQSGELAANKIGRGFQFESDVASVERFVRERARRSARQITVESRKAARNMLRRMRAQGLSPRQMRDRVRTVLGLDSRQANAVLNRAIALERRGVKSRSVMRAMKGDAEEKLTSRGQRIARFENLNAAQFGQDQAIGQAADGGWIDDVEEEWVSVNDADRDPLCKRLHGQRVKRGEKFVDPETGLEFSGAPAHHGCRCAKRYISRRTRRPMGEETAA